MPPFTLRHATAADKAFLYALYAATRADEFAAAGLPPEQLGALLRMQHRIRRRQYRTSYPDADDWIIEVDGRAVGRLLFHQASTPWVLVDIAILPDEQGRGLGGAVLRHKLTEARAAGIAIQGHVQASNPARRLYERLGFALHDDGSPYLAITYLPS